MSSSSPSLPRTAAILALASVIAPIRALAEPTDGVYGRLRTNTTLSADVGGGLALAPGASPLAGGVLAANVRFRTLDTAGAFLGYHWTFGVRDRSDALALGVELRPLALARLFTDRTRGPRWFDLTVDSLSIELGAAWLRPGQPWGGGSGLGVSVGTGMEFPLWWRSGDGLLARLGFRWVHAGGADWQGTGVDRDDTVVITLGLAGRVMVQGPFIPTD